MDEKIIFAGSMIITVIIEMIIMSQFIEERYKRSYQNKWVYIATKGVMGAIISCVNLLYVPIASILVWMISTGCFIGILYYHERKKTWMCILESEIVILIFCVCEAVGHIGLKIVFLLLKLPNVDGMISSGLAATFSNVVIIFFWYVFVARIWKKDNNLKYTASQYITHVVIAAYSIANLMVILHVMPHVTTMSERYLLLINMLCIVFADMYFLYFIKCIAERNQFQIEKELLEQQSELQYNYYLAENEKYQQSMLVFHDIKKHLRMITKLENENESEQAKVYTEQIAGMLKKIVPEQYTDQPILNILLLERKRQAEKEQIQFQVEVGNIDLSFMDTIDITTIFANLLDNAFEAAQQVSIDKFVDVKIQPNQDFTVIRIENSMAKEPVFRNGRPKTKKTGNHGYGLLNVERTVKKYDGNIQYEIGNNSFIAKIIINK